MSPSVMLRKLREAQLGQGRASELPKLSSNSLVKRLRIERVLEGHDGGCREAGLTLREGRGGLDAWTWAAPAALAHTATPTPSPLYYFSPLYYPCLHHYIFLTIVGCVNTVHWSPCGQVLVSGSDDQQVCLTARASPCADARASTNPVGGLHFAACILLPPCQAPACPLLHPGLMPIRRRSWGCRRSSFGTGSWAGAPCPSTQVCRAAHLADPPDADSDADADADSDADADADSVLHTAGTTCLPACLPQMHSCVPAIDTHHPVGLAELVC